MGANAQTAVPTFSASQVLTSTQQNNSARTGVPVFASTTTRNAAFGGSNKTLAEGQLCYVEGVGLQTYNAAGAWVTWGAAPTSGGLVYLTGASFTTQTSVSLPNSTFTSTYRNYRVMFQITAVTSDADFTMRLRASGTDDTTANYDYAFGGLSVSPATTSVSGAQTATSWVIGEQDAANVAYNLVLDVVAPQVATRTFINGSYTYVDKANSVWVARFGSGYFRSTTQFDALTFISSVASSITGVYRVYGYADS